MGGPAGFATAWGAAPRRGSRALVAGACAAVWLVGGAAPADAATRIWDGGDATDNWSAAVNWVGNLAVSPGDVLVFPAAVAQTSINDFAAGTAFASISFTGIVGGHDLTGNRVVVNSFSGSNTAGNNTVSLPVTLAAAATSTVTNALASITFAGPVDLAGNGLDLTGGGSHFVVGTVTGAGSITQSGTGGTLLASDAVGQSWSSRVTAGILRVTGNQPGNVVTVAGGSLTGNGTVGGVAQSGNTASSVAPNGVGVGRLTVDGDVALGAALTVNLQVDGVTPATEHDQLDVDGAVSFGNATLATSFGALLPTNQEVVIVDNDGADAVTGTFVGLSDGATFTAGPGSRTYRIQYDGGDGNDVTLTRLDESWTGGGGDGLWLTGANWSDGSAPTDGDSLMFESSGVGALSNNLPAGTDVAFAGFNVGGYTVTGNAVDLAGGMWASHPDSSTTEWGLPTRVTAPQTWETISGARLRVSGSVSLQAALAFAGDGLTDVAGVITSGPAGLTKNGSGTLVLGADNAVGGPTVLNAGTLTVSGDLSEGSLTVNAGVLNGSGSVGTTQVNGGTLEAGTNIAAHGILTVQGGLTLTGAATFAPELDGTTAGVGYDSVSVSGAVDLGGAVLAPDVGFSPADGDSFTILELGGGGPFTRASAGAAAPRAVTGTFAGLAEGAELTAGGTTFLITYQGGDGDDVVVTAQVPSASTSTSTSLPAATTTTVEGGTSTTTGAGTTTTTSGSTTSAPAGPTTTATSDGGGSTTTASNGPAGRGDLPTTGGGTNAPVGLLLLTAGTALVAAAARRRATLRAARRQTARGQ